MSETGYVHPEYLADSDWLAVHLDDPNVRIVDMRGYVKLSTLDDGEQAAQYSGAPDDYAAGHIPGAVYLDWTRDIIDPDDAVPVQVAPPERIAEIFGGVGIGDATTVVAYDSHPASQFATRLWWVLRYYSHDNVKVLNGGFPKWQREGRPVETDTPAYPAATFTPHVQPDMRATAADVVALIGQSDTCLLDARDTGQYSGAVRRGKRGGRIPGALNVPREELIGDDGTFRPAADLHTLMADTLGVQPDQHVVAYCNGGVAATVVLFSLSLMGYDHITNYDGSWNEWNEREELPISV